MNVQWYQAAAKITISVVVYIGKVFNRSWLTATRICKQNPLLPEVQWCFKGKNTYNFFSSVCAQRSKWRQDPFFRHRDGEPRENLSLVLPHWSSLQKCWLIKMNRVRFRTFSMFRNMLGEVSKLSEYPLQHYRKKKKNWYFSVVFLKAVLFRNLKSLQVKMNFKKSHTEIKVGNYFKINSIHLAAFQFLKLISLCLSTLDGDLFLPSVAFPWILLRDGNTLSHPGSERSDGPKSTQQNKKQDNSMRYLYHCLLWCLIIFPAKYIYSMPRMGGGCSCINLLCYFYLSSWTKTC